MYSSHPLSSGKNRFSQVITALVRLAIRMVVQPLRYCWQHKMLTAFALVIVFGFYWYEIRPIMISRDCSVQASLDARALLRSKAEVTKEQATRDSYNALIAKNMYLRSDYESFLQKCLLHYGFRIVRTGNQAVANGANASAQ